MQQAASRVPAPATIPTVTMPVVTMPVVTMPVVTMIEMVFPDQTNHYGTLFGGHALRLMDKAAFVAASRHARSAVVTACSERIDFKNAAHHGNLIELTARVVATGRTSMTVAVELHAEDLLTGDRLLCAEGRFVLVSLDRNGNPAPVTPIEPQ